MSDKPSLRKDSGAATSPATPKVPPPRFVLFAAVALVVSGVSALLGALSLFTSAVKSWIRDNARDSFSDDMIDKLKDARKAGPSSGTRGSQLDQLQNQLRDLKQTAGDMLNAKLGAIYNSVDQLSPGASAKGKTSFKDIRGRLDDVKNISDQITSAQKATLVQSAVVLIALGVAAAALLKGRPWARWAVIGLWVLATFAQSLAGISSVLGIAGDVPLLFKVPAFLSGLGLVVAVVLVNLRPSIEYLNRGRPVRPTATGGAARRGLFSPRPPVAPRTPAAEPKGSSSAADRARTKQRASSDAASAAKGAELARSRAKAANKSRRSGS